MTRFATLAALAVLAAPAAAPATALAANAQHPYSNVDHRVDAGNNTGDSQVEALNQQQLNRNGTPGPVTAAPYGGRRPAYPYAPPASYVPPPGYAYAPPPPVVYAPPPVVYAPYYPPYRYYRPYYPY